MKTKIGDTVQAIFRKYGRHTIVGEVFEVCKDEHSLPGTWVGIKVIGGDLQDSSVQRMVAMKLAVLVPEKDIQKILISTAA